MKDYLKILATFIAGFILLEIFVLNGSITIVPKNQPIQQKLGGGFVTEIATLDGSGSSNSTSTVTYLTTGLASTTFAFLSTSAESIDLNMSVYSSTTASSLIWKYEFSDNNIDWYGEDGKTIDSKTSVTHSATTTIHHWTPGQIATSTKNVTVTPVASKYTRVSFAADNANLSLWVEAVKKRIIGN